jgi:hypothetical protein
MNTLQRCFDRFSKSAKYRPLWTVFYRLTHPVTKSSVLSRYPALYFPYARWLKPATFWTLPDERTGLLIESAGSSASFAFAEYVKKHNPDLRVSHGCEVPATVKFAVRHGIPVIVLTRNMLDFVQSAISRFPQTAVRNAVRCYADFHRHLLPLRDKIVVADFHVVREDPAGVIRACNAKYGTAFNEGDNVLPRIRKTQTEGT